MNSRRQPLRIKVFSVLIAACVIFVAGRARAQGNGNSPNVAQVVALDECDPPTFNVDPPNGAGPDFCKNVALYGFGYSTALSDLLSGAQAGTPDPGWDFEPDTLTIKQGTTVSVVDQGGEPHTFTEVKAFGNGFLPPLNTGASTRVIPECQGGFKNIAVARTRVVQGSHLDVTGLSKGKHLFQCCIHPWMRMEVDVQ